MAYSALTQPLASSKAPQATEHRLWELVFTVAVCVLIVLLLLRPIYLPIVQGDHYVYLASHLVRGELSVDDLPAGYPDFLVWQGHKYLPFGPLPGVLLIPFLPIMNLLGTHDQALASYVFTLLNVLLLWSILNKTGVAGERRKWSLLLFFGGTIYYAASVVSATWYIAHVFTTTFLLLAIWEALGKRRPWLIGIFLGLAGLVRFTALFALPFFVWLLWRSKSASATETTTNDSKEKSARSSTTTQYALLFAGLVGPVLLQFLYNFARFGDPLDSGYAHAVLTNPVLAEALSHGLFGLVHVPKNLFMLLLQGPVPYPSEGSPVLQFPYLQPSPWGMGIFLTSPALIYIFRAKLREHFIVACWLGVIAVMLPVITYYGVGWVQFGFRYALDFTPFLVLLAARGLPGQMSNLARGLITLSVVINIWGAFYLAKWV